MYVWTSSKTGKIHHLDESEVLAAAERFVELGYSKIHLLKELKFGRRLKDWIHVGLAAIELAG